MSNRKATVEKLFHEPLARFSTNCSYLILNTVNYGILFHTLKVICDVVHARCGDHGCRVHVAPQQGHWDSPVACGGIVDASIHSVVPPAIVSKAVGRILRVACLACTMLAVVEHRSCCAISHHIWEGKEKRNVYVIIDLNLS